MVWEDGGREAPSYPIKRSRLAVVEGMTDMVQLLERWQLDVGDLRERMYRAPTPRERERWHGLWLLAQGWSATQVAEALEREPHTIGNWLDNFRQGGAQGCNCSDLMR